MELNMITLILNMLLIH